ncbi:MAG TPA: AglZ/HisF2 family acetamidino modification protein [Gemmatimonadaceae bacterium]|nr:AglZ/HisF2 family acetamidino modification protein [Gemmatimonadaceae bacterium]
MIRARIIPFLLTSDSGLVKTIRFGKRRYLGDAINAVRIFNEKEVDELVLLDIDATTRGTGPRFDNVEEVLSEAFMPVGYGGGITSLAQVERLFRLGVEKVVLNSVLADRPELLSETSRVFGAQSIVASMDVKRDLLGRRRAWVRGGSRKLDGDPIELLRRWEQLGAGEVVVNSIDRDGTRQGLDLELTAQAAAAVEIPVVAVGGAGEAGHLVAALKAGASAVGAGSMFVFHGVHQAVLISYIDRGELAALTAAAFSSTTASTS